jgi:hypothetical protein
MLEGIIYISHMRMEAERTPDVQRIEKDLREQKEAMHEKGLRDK